MTVAVTNLLPPTPHVVPAGADVDRSPERRAWLDELERLTRTHREDRAAVHRARADVAWTAAGRWLTAAMKALRSHSPNAGTLMVRSVEASERAKWHDQRALGQIERFQRVAGCQNTWTVTVSCLGCGAVGEPMALTCSHDRLCVRCRGRRVRRVRARLLKAAMHWSEEGRKANIRHRLWGYDRLGMKMLTLTLPHSGDIARDAQTLRKSWGAFRRRLAAHFIEDRQSPILQYWRTREETPGTRADGHVHYHVLMIAPYVHHAIYRLLWARALPADYQAKLPMARVEWSVDGTEVVALHRTLRSGEQRTERIESAVHRRQIAQALVTRRGPHGRPLDEMPWPVIDVRGAGAAHASASPKGALKAMVAEAAKYVVKDLEKIDAAGNRTLVDPPVYAAMYCATDGMRRTSCTMTRTGPNGAVLRAGWWVIEWLQPYVCTCPDCGHTGPRECTVERAGRPLARGP